MTYPLQCAACGHDASEHHGEHGCWGQCGCGVPAASLYAEECARLSEELEAYKASNEKALAHWERTNDDLFAARAEVARLRGALTDIVVSYGSEYNAEDNGARLDRIARTALSTPTGERENG